MTAAAQAHLSDEHVPRVIRAHPDDVPWDSTSDVAIVGSGAAAWSAAIGASLAGAAAVVLEKAEAVGGTSAQAGGAVDGQRASTWLWICDNPLMAEHGIVDRRAEAISYMARLARPHEYHPDAPCLGLPGDEYDLIEAFYEHGGRVVSTLRRCGALEFQIVPGVYDYYSDLPENTVPQGRTLAFLNADGEEGIGIELVEMLRTKATQLGASLRTESPVMALVVDEGSGDVVGVLAGDRAATLKLIRVRKGVVFATGGFARDEQLRRDFLRGPLLASLSSHGNTGDFLRIATELGAALGNMNEAWLTPVVLSHGAEPAGGAFRLPGDSMLIVNRQGRRVVNEKATYNEMTRVFFRWDETTAEYINVPLVVIYDEWVAQHCRRLDGDVPTTDGGGNPLPAMGGEASHELVASSLDLLADEIQAYLHEFPELLPDAELAEDFASTLRETIDRFNSLASNGVDTDFGRGSTRVQHARSGPSHVPAAPNPTMHPLSARGPYYAIVLVPGALDTKGGPRTDRHGRVLLNEGQPLNGLYGAGNCVASPAGQAYWGGGATLGLGVTFGFVAGEHAAGRR